ncbi:GNAT family N-acetyltransferase [Caldimonas tepidiphila]|uniref:GNAT family N-acetyltransferase n=1 Tax=Caldimonas tepidiphila TaxID=2315841 RepID=UPI001F0C5E00|nr:GNAT family protein [Caldimonas tepidiphila]
MRTVTEGIADFLVMNKRTNEYGQPIGGAIPDWQPRALPQRMPLKGDYCVLEPLDPARHGGDLWRAYQAATDGRQWTYMPVGPFADDTRFRAHLELAAGSPDPLHFAVVDRATQRAVGTLALMRMDPANGVIEVGHVAFSPALQRTRAATEAQYLLMRLVFDELHYRRYEWKCDSLNAPSRQAAQRLGFQFEGVFRQAVVYKQRSRDTAWFSVIDSEWSVLRDAFVRWLAPGNFDGERQKASLASLRSSAG